MYRISFNAFSIFFRKWFCSSMDFQVSFCLSLSNSKSFISDSTIAVRTLTINCGKPVWILRISIPGVLLLAQNLYLSAYSVRLPYNCSNSFPSPRYQIRLRIALVSKSIISWIWILYGFAGWICSQLLTPRRILSLIFSNHLISYPPQNLSWTGRESSRTGWH